MIAESDLEFRYVNVEELSLFLVLTTTAEELQEHNLKQYCPTRSNKGRAPTLTSSGTCKSKSKRWSGWTVGKEKPSSEADVRRMIAFAIGRSLKVTLENHVFRFNSKCYKQMKGGAIGIGVAGDVANLFMVWWDKQIKMKLDRDGISVQMYSRYVDDINIVCKMTSPEPGRKESDETIMKHIQRTANSIHKSIKVTIDYPSNHDNGRMPVLDLEQWIGQVKVNNVTRNQILHSHYMKTIASRSLINKNSAISQDAKINILVADLVRIMRNVSQQCENKERAKHVQHFVNRMQFSGYTQEDRFKVYRKAKRKFDKIVERDITGECPMYRGKFWDRERREMEKMEKRNKWYERGGYETVMFVDATPNGELAAECKKALKDSELGIRVVERSGKSIRKVLSKSDPFQETSCGRENCKVCEINPKINCRARDVVYRVTCNGCVGRDSRDGTYIGETARSIGERASEHFSKYENKDKNSVFHKHMVERHDAVPQRLALDLLAKCPGDAMLRQVTEAVFINELNPTLNTKEEWGNSNKLRERRTGFEPINLSNLRSKNCQRTQHSGDSSILTEEAAGGLRKF